MSVNSQSPEMMAIYRAYAASLGPAPTLEYKIVHKWHTHIQVPQGYLPIKIVQFSRGPCANGENRLYHWAIFIPTSTRRGVGNFYEIGGSLREGYFTQHLVHNRHVKWDDERGAHLVGYVAPDWLGRLEAHLSLVPIVQGRADWNCQTWVVEGLRGLNYAQMYAVQMEYGQWFQQMEILEAAWNVGDA